MKKYETLRELTAEILKRRIEMKRLFGLILAVLLIATFLMNTVIACADSRSGINISNLSKSITKGEIKKVLGKPEMEDKKGFDYTWMRYEDSYFCGLYCSLIELFFARFQIL